ncbi:MAG: HD domain-containing protein [Nitrososphaerales archaeon]
MSKKETIIRDPIHAFISLSHFDFIEPLVKTSYFQRLRRLAQLGVSVYVYPSATHNRLNHALGAMELFVKLFDHLFKDSINDNDVQNLKRLGVAATLLHDTGHGPFSHASETAFEFKHEDFSKKIVAEAEIKDILQKEGIDHKDVNAVISNTVTDKKVIISQLVSSELDVDRLDYLSRDSYFTGAGFGNIDLQRIVRTMTVFNDNGPLKNHAVTQFKGKYSLEAYVLARHLMYQGVYFHKATRCVEKLIEAALTRAEELAQENKLPLPDELAFLNGGNEMTLEQHQNLDDHVIFSILAKWTKSDDPILSDLSKRILNRDLLKAIEVQQKDISALFHKNSEIRKLLSDNGLNDAYYFLLDDPKEQPYKPYKPIRADEEASKTVMTNIFVLKEDGAPEEISDLSVSEVVNALTKYEYSFRVYVPEKYREQVRSLLGKDQIVGK